MSPLRITAVSYLNTYPFVYGLKESGILRDFDLSLRVPSLCAESLRSGDADIALVPVAALTEMANFRFISDFCIGAAGEVRTVLLLSKVPLEKIRRVHLDFDSRTSVELVKVLARRYWKISPAWKELPSGPAASQDDLESVVAIGDKTFAIRNRYPYVYDLAEAWIAMTGLPFVFAAWVSARSLPDEVVLPFSAALKYGVDRRKETLEYFRDRLPAGVDCLSYLENNISYNFDPSKKQGLDLFLSYLCQKG